MITGVGAGGELRVRVALYGYDCSPVCVSTRSADHGCSVVLRFTIDGIRAARKERWCLSVCVHVCAMACEVIVVGATLVFN